MKPLLQISDLYVSIAGNSILNGINLTVNPGEVHAIMGPNGSGKSTLANVIAGREEYVVESGSILYKGQDPFSHDTKSVNIQPGICFIQDSQCGL